jgi:ABC-2 type transport system permease protein
MSNTWVIFKREMMAYFYSPIAYIVGVCVLLLVGINFQIILEVLSQPGSPTEYGPMMWFFNTFFTWLVLLLAPPIITMRLFSDEKRMGTLEGLMTVPLRDIDYVLGKFLSAYVFFILLWVPTFNYVYVLRYFSKEQAPLDLGPIVGGYLGIFLIGMLLIALGCIASASTRNQIIAAIISFSFSAGLLCIGMLAYYDKSNAVKAAIAMTEHLSDFSRGMVDWRRVVFYLSSTALSLFITHRMVQSRHWKT